MKVMLSFLLLVLIPVAFALDCSKINDEDCDYVLDSLISDEEKDYLISDLTYNDKAFPDFDAVYTWNTVIDTSEPPENTEKHGSWAIKNAWVKALAVMPSVIEDNVLLSSGKGKFLCTSGYNIELPKDLIGDDCKTVYKLAGHKGEVKTYVNNVYQGSGKLVDFESKGDYLKFDAELNVEASVKIDHHKWRRYCCSRGAMGQCTYYCRVCEYRETEIKKDTLKITDTIYAKGEKLKAKHEFEVLNKYNGNTKGRFDFSDVTAFELNFRNSNFMQTEYLYETNFSIPPYNIMTLTSIPFKQSSFSNMVMEDNKTFLVKNTNGCKIVLHNYFNKSFYSCNLTYNPIKIHVETDKLSYFENETIKVSLKPNDIEVNVSYADTSRIVRGRTEFKAVYPHNSITAHVGDVSYSKAIAVKTKEQWSLFFQLTTFAGLNYLFFLGVRKFGKLEL